MLFRGVIHTLLSLFMNIWGDSQIFLCYEGITSQQKLCPSEGAILEIKQWGPLLLYVTQRGGVHAWDTRMKRDAWVLPVTPRLGLVEHMALDPSDRGMWLLTGSSRGYLALWDARFHLQVTKDFSEGHYLGCSF